jgi:hypothetical protein
LITGTGSALPDHGRDPQSGAAPGHDPHREGIPDGVGGPKGRRRGAARNQQGKLRSSPAARGFGIPSGGLDDSYEFRSIPHPYWRKSPRSGEQDVNARPRVTSYDSGHEHSPEHWLDLRRLVAESDEATEGSANQPVAQLLLRIEHHSPHIVTPNLAQSRKEQFPCVA